ncbi:MAG: hypothetical protein M3169_02060 [Candidatus Eremiobacteraeota bacterium]|nr:hypothetical protein [Candidatus Eremiobacteraeota bacterium]
MKVRPTTVGAVVVIIVVGFAIGAWLAIRTRGPAVQTTHVTVASQTQTPPHTARPLAATPAPTALPTAVSIVTAEPIATPAPKPPPTPTRSTPSTAAPSAAPIAAGANPAVQGSWRLDEANVQVGTIVWVGDAVPASRNSIVLNVRKESVGGRRAMPCERQTALHAAFAVGVPQQTVPYREVNCDGVVSTGEVRVTSFSSDGASFSGSFSQNGANLGTFTARKL